MAVVSIEGYYDLHLHSAPAPFRRIGDSIDVAEWCAAAGMAGIVIKSHFESTVSKAYHAARAVKSIRVFSGVGLNRGAGGVNPGAAELALHQGAKIVWLPTFDAENHARVFGHTGTYGWPSMTLDFKGGNKPRGRFTVLQDGKLTQDAKEIVELVRDYDAVLATGHLSKEEIFAVMDYAVAAKLRKVLVTHPEYTVPNLDIDSAVQLARAGAFMEFCGASCFPMPGVTRLERIKEMIEAVGLERAVLASDSGQPFNPRPPETFRVFVQCLHERGMPEEALRQIGIKNAEYLLGV
jgi:hypothetical protein